MTKYLDELFIFPHSVFIDNPLVNVKKNQSKYDRLCLKKETRIAFRLEKKNYV